MGERRVWIEAAFGGFRVMVEDAGQSPWTFFAGNDFGEALIQAGYAMGHRPVRIMLEAGE